jgi:hypothetical protein
MVRTEALAPQQRDRRWGRDTYNELLDILGQLSASSPLGRESADLLLSWHLAGKQKPEQALGKGLRA